MNPRRRLWFAAGAALALAFGVAGGHWLPQWGLRWGLAKALTELGWSRVGIGAADIALFDGAVVIRRVEAGASLGDALGIGGLDLTFRWKPLFSHRVSLEQIDLSGVEVEVRRDGDGFVVNGLPLTGGTAAGGGWSFDVTALTLTDSRLLYADGDFTAAIAVDRLELTELRSWDPDHPASFRLAGRLNGSRLDIAGTATPFAARAGFALRIELDGLDLGAFAEPAGRGGLAPLAGRLSGALALAGGSGRALTAEGDLAVTGASAGYDGVALGAARLDWRGRLAWSAGTAEAAGTVRAAALAIGDGPLAITADTATLDAVSVRHDGRQLSLDGRLDASAAQVRRDDVAVVHRRLAWAGGVTVDGAGGYRADGRAEAEDIRIAAGALTMTARKAVAEGSLADGAAEGILPPLAGRMNVTAETVGVAEPGRDWLAARRLEAREVTWGSPLRIGRLEAAGLDLLGGKGRGPGAYPWRIEARSLAVTGAELDGAGGVAAAEAIVGGGVLRATRTRDGLLGWQAGGDGGGRRLALGRLRLAADSRLEFEDRVPSEPVRLVAEGVDLTMDGIDTARPDQDSRFSLTARIGAARIAADGSARPFAARPGGELSGDIRALDLPPLSPYAADALGVHLHTGQLDAEFVVAARQGKLDGSLHLGLNQLFVAQPDPAAPLARQADMPLETVLDLLRDGDNRIRLSIPVRGDLDAPDFDVSDAVNQAIGGALKSTVFTTLKVAFPVAALIGFVIDEAENPRLSLEPLAFPAGTDALAESERSKLGKVAGLLGQRPGLKLTLCGIASQHTDWPVLMQAKREEELGIVARLQKLMGTAPKPESVPVDRDRLAGLAEARAQAAKAFLVDDSGIDPGRLFTCRPKVESEATAGATAGPRVDLLL